MPPNWALCLFFKCQSENPPYFEEDRALISQLTLLHPSFSTWLGHGNRLNKHCMFTQQQVKRLSITSLSLPRSSSLSVCWGWLITQDSAQVCADACHATDATNRLQSGMYGLVIHTHSRLVWEVQTFWHYTFFPPTSVLWERWIRLHEATQNVLGWTEWQ